MRGIMWADRLIISTGVGRGDERQECAEWTGRRAVAPIPGLILGVEPRPAPLAADRSQAAVLPAAGRPVVVGGRPASHRHVQQTERNKALNTPYEGLNLANQISRKLGVFDRKLEENHSTFHCYSDIY